MGGLVLSILVWQEGGEFVLLLMAVGAVALGSLVRWLAAASGPAGRPSSIPDALRDPDVQAGHLPADAAADRARRRHDRAADLPADGPRVQRDGGGPLAGSPVAEHVRGRDPRRSEGGRAVARAGSSASASSCWRSGWRVLLPIVPRADSGLGAGRPAGRRRLRARPARLAAEQLHAGADLRGAGQRGRRHQLRRRFVRPLLRSRVRRRHHAGHAVGRLHGHGRGQLGPAARRPGTGRRDARATTRR